MSCRAYMPNVPDDSFVDELAAVLDSRVDLATGDAVPDPAVFDVLIAGRPTAEQLAAMPGLRAVVIPFAGVPETTRELMRTWRSIAFHNLHHNAAPTAEMAQALLLAAAKRIVPADRALRDGDWSIRYQNDRAALLDGRTAVILGYGAIGRRIARACLGLGMNAIAVRRRIDAPVFEDGVSVHPVAELDAVLPRADVLFIALPHTDATDGLLNANRLSRLPKQTILVNIARGGIIDEAALYHALRDGRIAAAGLDVWWQYPEDETARSSTLPSEYPFRELDNVVMSPHRAGHGEATERLRACHLAELLNAAAHGKVMPNRIDPDAGY